MAVKESQKYEQIIIAAKELFWKFGISRVTVEEICIEADVSRMTFYKYFRNKTELIKTIIEKIYTASLERYDSIMAEDLSYQEKVRKIIVMKIEGTNDISKEFLKDFYNQSNQELVDFFNRKIKESLDRILSGFSEARENGDIRRDIKPEFLLYFLNRIFEMANDDELLRLYDSAQEMILEITNIFFYGILPVNTRE